MPTVNVNKVKILNETFTVNNNKCVFTINYRMPMIMAEDESHDITNSPLQIALSSPTIPQDNAYLANAGTGRFEFVPFRVVSRSAKFQTEADERFVLVTVEAEGSLKSTLYYDSTETGRLISSETVWRTYEFFTDNSWTADGQTQDVPIVNTAGDQFENALSEIRTIRGDRLLLAYKAGTLRASDLDTINGAINKEKITIMNTTAEARCAKITLESSERVPVKDSWEWRLGFLIEYKSDTWDVQVLNQGFRILTDSSNVLSKRNILNSDLQADTSDGDERISDPVTLGLTGTSISSEPIYLPFVLNKPINFEGLNLPVTRV